MANRFWVGGTGTWDASTTTHWAATSNGAGGQTVPGSSDTVTFDGSSGGGTVTVDFGGPITLQSLTCGAFTGTLDFSANNNSVTLTANTGFSGTGSGTRTISLGNGTWTLSNTVATWSFSTTTNLTFNANSSTITFSSTASTSSRTFQGGGLTYNALTISGNTSGGSIILSGSNTFSSLTVNAPNYLAWSNTTQTATTFTLSGGSSSALSAICNSQGSLAGTLSVASGTVSLPWTSVRGMIFSGGATFTATNSFDNGFNSGITITPPSAAGGLLVNRGMSGGMSG